MERLTPVEIQKRRFRICFRGFDQKEVSTFLETVSNEMEELLLENQKLREENQRRKQEIEEYQGLESTLKSTLITAQKTIDEMKANAEKEAALIVSQAQIQAEKSLEDAQRRLSQLVDEINALKTEKIRFEASLRSELELHLKILEARSLKERETVNPESEIKTS